MKKRKIAFIDHSAHALTGSSAFFRRVLEEKFSTTLLYISPDLPIDRNVIDLALMCDSVVIWQMDFLAPIFISAGLSTIVVPMFDGSANMPDLHWNWAKQASFICFSWTMYDRLRILGCRTYLAKYFVSPLQEEHLPSFEEYKVFMWQRRPEEGIHGDMVVRLMGDQIDNFHIHDAPDDPNVCGSDYYKLTKPFSPTISRWFEKKEHFDDCLMQSNVFIAPRRAEGIGMAHLEAMARGMLVLAHDQPTHTEYIANWVNGILFNADDVGFAEIPRDAARTMARTGWLTAVEGRQEWEDTRSSLLGFVTDTCPPSSMDKDIFETIVAALPKAYFGGLDKYTDYLENNRNNIMAMAGVKGNSMLRPLATINVDVPILRGYTMTFSSGQGRPYLLSGGSHDESEAVWLVGRATDIAFRWFEADPSVRTLTITCRAIGASMVSPKAIVSLNDEVVGSFSIKEGWMKYIIHSFNVEVKIVNRLSIYLSQAMDMPADGKKTSLILQEVTLNTPFEELQSELKP